MQRILFADDTNIFFIWHKIIIFTTEGIKIMIMMMMMMMMMIIIIIIIIIIITII